MKAIICLLFITITLGCAQSQPEWIDRDWRATLKVVDQTGHPVAGAEARVYYKGTNVIVGMTDTNGVFVATNHDRSVDLAFDAVKAGYYPFHMGYHLGFYYEVDKWNPTQTILLNQIINPIPMYAKEIHRPPSVDGKPLGYDLSVGDWMPPYGKGLQTDIIFEQDSNRKSGQDYDYKLTVGFPNSGDGIEASPVRYEIMEGSTLRSAHNAPVEGYERQIVKLNNAHPGRMPVFEFRENSMYYLRVRTVLDEKGDVISACYGKIYGDFMRFKYYLNPAPNDRNVEFDPKRNLLKGGDVGKDP